MLLVDNHEGVREVTAAGLAEMGHQVVSVEDGPRMLALLAARPNDFDLIVSDYAMPLMSGCDMLDRAREIRPDLPGIIITGYAESGSIAKKPAGVPVLAKPFSGEQLADSIRGAMAAMRGVCPPELSH